MDIIAKLFDHSVFFTSQKTLIMPLETQSRY